MSAQRLQLRRRRDRPPPRRRPVPSPSTPPPPGRAHPPCRRPQKKASPDFSGFWLSPVDGGVALGPAWTWAGESDDDARPGALYVSYGAALPAAGCAAAAGGASLTYGEEWWGADFDAYALAPGALPAARAPAAAAGAAATGTVGAEAWAPSGWAPSARLPSAGGLPTNNTFTGCGPPGAAAAVKPVTAAAALAAITPLTPAELAALPVYGAAGMPPLMRGFFALTTPEREVAVHVCSAEGCAFAGAPEAPAAPGDLFVGYKQYLSYDCVGEGARVGGGRGGAARDVRGCVGRAEGEARRGRGRGRRRARSSRNQTQTGP